MTTVTLEIPEKIKTIWKNYISPDLDFTDYDNLNQEHKKMYDKVDNIDKNTLLNI